MNILVASELLFLADQFDGINVRDVLKLLKHDEIQRLVYS